MRARQTIEAGTARRSRPAVILLVLVAALRRGPLLAQDRAASDTHSPSAAAGDAGAAAAPGGFISDPSSLASWLAAHPRVERTFFPGDPKHPDAANIVRLFPPNRYGGLVSFELRDAARKDV